MFCNKCGTNVADGLQFCTNCGAQLDGGASGECGGYVPPKKNDNKTIAIAIAAVAVIAVIAVWFFFFRSTPKGTVKKYFNGMQDGDVKKVMSVMPYEKDSDIYEMVEESLEASFDYMPEEYEDAKVKIGDVDKLDKDEIEELNETYEDVDGSLGEIKDAAEVEITIGIDGDEEGADELTVVKIGGKWYVLLY